MRRPASVLAAALLLAGCGTSTIRADGAARSVADVVAHQTGFHPADVRCPTGVEAKAGRAFSCHFTGPGGTRYLARVQILGVHGSRVRFFVRTRPSG